jgi:hypothetical protein
VAYIDSDTSKASHLLVAAYIAYASRSAFTARGRAAAEALVDGELDREQTCT